MADPKLKTGFRMVVWRELKRMGSRPLYLLITFILPLSSFIFFATIFGDGVLRKLPVAVYDADASMLSRKVLQQLEASPSIKFAQHVESTEQGREMIENGDVLGLIVIPKNFQRDVYRSESPDVVAYYNNLALSAGSAIGTSVQTIVGTISAGVNLQKRTSQKEMKEQATVSVQPIQVDSHALYNPYLNYTYYLASALLPIMLQMFVLVSVIYAVGLELKEYTAADWLRVADGNMVKAISGKLLPYSIIFTIMGLFVNSILFDYMKVPMHGNRLMLDFGLFLMVLAYQAIAITVIFGFANLRLSISLGAGYGAMAFSFSGLAFPIHAMSGFFQGFSNAFPFKFYWLGFVDQAFRAAPLSITAEHFLVLNMFLLLPFLIFRRAKRVVSNEMYWGKL